MGNLTTKQTVLIVILLVIFGEFIADKFARNADWIIVLVIAGFGIAALIRMWQKRRSRK